MYGVPFARVYPKGTSKFCPICGGSLKEQDRECPSCRLYRHNCGSDEHWPQGDKSRTFWCWQRCRQCRWHCRRWASLRQVAGVSPFTAAMGKQTGWKPFSPQFLAMVLTKSAPLLQGVENQAHTPGTSKPQNLHLPFWR